MKVKYAFSKAERGKFYHPEAVFNFPIHLDPDAELEVSNMMQSTVTVHLPNTTLDQLRRTAQQQQKTVEDVVCDLVVREVTSLPALPDDVEDELTAFRHLSDDVLFLLAQSTLSLEQQNEIVHLNQEAQQRILASSEQNQQDYLVTLYERVLVRRAEASKILKERGYDLYNLPDPSALS